MEYVGIELDKKESQICLLTEMGEVIRGRRCLEARLGNRSAVPVACEASIGPSVPGCPVPWWASSPSGAERALVGGTSVGGWLWTP